MTSSPTLIATLAALALVVGSAGAADARSHHHHHHRHSHMQAMSHNGDGMARGGRTAQDNMADQLNAQSLQQSQGSGMQGAPMGGMQGGAPMGAPQ